MPDEIQIQTDRQILRAYRPDDAAQLTRLIGDRKIAETTLNIPHPYSLTMAEEWIAKSSNRKPDDPEVTLAITLRSAGEQLIGGIGLHGDQRHDSAELGYWIGVPYWNQGHITEAAQAMIRYGFEQLKLNRIHAHHFLNNPASGRVMQKLGMTCEGRLRQHVKKWDKYLDIDFYGILRAEFEQRHWQQQQQEQQQG